MAIFHQRCRILTRSHGKSPVASSAYQAGEKLKEERTKSTYSYSKPEVGDKGILAPEGAPNWVLSRAELWNQVDAFEDQMIHARYSVSGKTGAAKAKTLAALEKALSSAQTAQVSERSLPVELTLEQNVALVKRFFHECYVSKGFIVDYAIHMDEGNPHVHYMVPLRALEGGTFAKKKETSYRRTPEVRNLFDRGGMKEVAQLWCRITNEALREAGINAQIDHRSYKERGIDLVPTKHRGYNADKIERMGGTSRIVLEDKDVRLENVRRVLKNPMLLLKKVAGERVLFRKEDVEKALLNLVSVDMEAYTLLKDKMDSFMMGEAANQNGDERLEDLVSQWVGAILRPQKESFWSRVLAFAKIKAAPDVAKHVTDNLYTFKSIQDKEDKIIGLVDELSSKVMKPTLVQGIKGPIDVEQEVKGIEKSLKLTFTEEQRNAIDHLMKNDRIQVLSGRAGTGKTTLLRAVCHLYQKQGYEIMGTAFQGRVVEALQNDLNHPAYTLSKLTSVWDYYRGKQLSPRAQQTLNQYSFRKNHVVILDEGSMVPDDLWVKLLGEVKAKGAKLIILQDQMQIKALYGLDIPRYVEEKVGACTLKTVVRQSIPWQKEASVLLNDHYTLEGLKAYEGRIIKEESRIVDDFLKDQEAQIMLTLSNKDVDRLNNEAFEKLLEKGVLKDPFTYNGKSFAIGARVMFGENDSRERQVKTGDNKGVRNGTMGIITAYDKGEVRVRVVDGRMVAFRDYKKLTLAYAITINKSQGATFDKTFVLYHPLMDANKMLVALTRHIKDTWIYSKRSVEEMARGGEYKPLLRDYTLTEAQEKLKQLVQDYKESHKTIAICLKSGQGVKEAGETRKAYALRILKEWDQTRLFVMQSGLRREIIERHAGIRSQGVPSRGMPSRGIKSQEIRSQGIKSQEISGASRPSSRMEREIERRLNEHKAISAEVRERSEISLRLQRDKLAYEILENKEIQNKTLQRQAASYALFLKDEKVFGLVESFKGALYSNNYEQRDILAVEALKEIDARELFIDQSVYLKIQRCAVLGELRATMDAYGKAQTLEARNDAYAQIKQMVFGERFYKDRYAVFKEKGGNPRDFRDLRSRDFKDGLPYSEIRDRLEPETYAHHLLGRHTHHYGNELIWDRPESKISLNKETGQWQDFKTGESGDLIGLTSYVKGFGKSEALLYAKGEAFGVNNARALDTGVKTIRHKSASQERASQEESIKKAIETVKDVAGWSRPIEGTVAETYLRKHRGIKTADLPHDLKFLPDKGLIALARDKEGRATACQVTSLNLTTGRKDTTVDVPKRSHGKVSGSFVMIQEGACSVYVAEGVETALSLKEAGIEGTIVASLGLHNLGKADHLVKGDQSLIIVADHDGPDKPSTKHLQKIVEGYEGRGINCFTTMPKGQGRDFNDVLQTQGRSHVQEQVKSQMVKGSDYRAQKTERAPQKSSLDDWEMERKHPELTKSIRDSLQSREALANAYKALIEKQFPKKAQEAVLAKAITEHQILKTLGDVNVGEPFEDVIKRIAFERDQRTHHAHNIVGIVYQPKDIERILSIESRLFKETGKIMTDEARKILEQNNRRMAEEVKTLGKNAETYVRIKTMFEERYNTLPKTLDSVLQQITGGQGGKAKSFAESKFKFTEYLKTGTIPEYSKPTAVKATEKSAPSPQKTVQRTIQKDRGGFER